MPVLEEAKTMVYVTNHNMITMATVIFKAYKMTDKGEQGNSIDQNSRLFLFYGAFYLSFGYYELGSTLRTGSNYSCAIVLRLSRALWALRTHCVCNATGSRKRIACYVCR